MIITIRTLATIRKYLPQLEEETRLRVPDGISIKKLLELFGVPEDLSVIILVNGRPKPDTHRLSNGDTLVLFPSLEGG